MSMQMGIAEQIKEIALNNSDWRHHEKAQVVYHMYDQLNEKFFKGELPQAVIGFDPTGRIKKDGKYWYESDDLAVPHHIDLAKGLTPAGTMVALLKNMLYLKSEVYYVKANWYHSQAWRTEMTKFGLTTNTAGDVTDFSTKFFKSFCEVMGLDATKDLMGKMVAWGQEYVEGAGEPDLPMGIETEATVAPEVEQEEEAPKKAKTLRKKWICKCVKGITPDGDLGSTAIHTTRMVGRCLACDSEWVPAHGKLSYEEAVEKWGVNSVNWYKEQGY